MGCSASLSERIEGTLGMGWLIKSAALFIETMPYVSMVFMQLWIIDGGWTEHETLIAWTLFWLTASVFVKDLRVRIAISEIK